MEPKKKVQKLATTFSCPFCNHADSVDCTIDLKLRIAEVACHVCKESYSTKAHELTEPIDVYSEWIDECEKVNVPLSDDHRDSSHDDNFV